MKIAGYNLGCKVNKYELDSILESFENRGYEIVDFDDEADVYIINTCAVTQLAEKKSRQMINRAKKHNGMVVAAGCYTQKESVKVEGVDIVVGATKKSSIVELVESHLETHGKINVVEDVKAKKDYDNMQLTRMGDMTRAYVKIQDGCDNFCSYCIIPHLRGRVRSRELDDIIEEVKTLSINGYKEIVLTGIEVASYGKEFDDISLINVIEDVSKIDGIERIRLSSIYPNVITEEFMKRVSELSKVCDHFHLSLQSGCTETLKRMNRKYTAEEYKEAVDTIRKYMPDAAITTDIIVGFPGETNEEFEATYKFVEDIKFAQIHTFKYSIRTGTPAEKMADQVEISVKDERSKKLIELNEKLHKEFLQNQVGKTIPVLFEKKNNQSNNSYEGHTTNYIRVISECRGKLCSPVIEGEIVKVKIIESKNDYLVGESFALPQ